MVQLSFYLAKHGTWEDKLIAWWTRPKFWDLLTPSLYSHVEILFSNQECFSSSGRDGGCRWKYIDNINSPHSWTTVPISQDEAFEKALISECERQVNKKYDWFCIFFSNLIPFDIQEHDKWTCSELVARLIYNKPMAHRYTPTKLADMVGLKTS